MPYLGATGEIKETGSSIGRFSFEWRTPDFSFLSGERGDYYESPAFYAFDGEWNLEMFPNGFSSDELSGCVHVFLCRTDYGPPKTLNVTLGVMGPEGVENTRERVQEFSAEDDACCWRELCWNAHQSVLMMPGIITCDMKNVVPSVTRDSSTQTVEKAKEAEMFLGVNTNLERQGTEELKESLKRLLESGKETDVVIKIQGKEFTAHRLLLQARSPVFEAMFSHDMVEKVRGVVTMEECDAGSFPAFLEHVYTGSTGMISSGNVFSLYEASEMYDLKTLNKACAEFVKKNLTVTCFCDAITMAVKYDEKELIELATEFFCSNSLDICKTVEWQIFLKENTTMGNELIIKAFSK